MAERILDLIQRYDQMLDRQGVEAPRRNVELMLQKVLGLKRVELYLQPDRVLSDEQAQCLRDFIGRRLDFEPLQYILGECEFYGLGFQCDRRARIPRPETEFVVSKGLELLSGKSGLDVLDLGTGSGNIVVAMAKNDPRQKYYASDLSEDALTLAKENTIRHGLKDRIKFFCGNIYAPLVMEHLLFDLILANPPYIRAGEFMNLSEQIRRYEPLKALIAGADGLEFIRPMLKDAPLVMRPGGYLVFEMAQGQAPAIRSLLDQQKELRIVETIEDYSGVERVMVIRRESA